MKDDPVVIASYAKGDFSFVIYSKPIDAILGMNIKKEHRWEVVSVSERYHSSEIVVYYKKI